MERQNAAFRLIGQTDDGSTISIAVPMDYVAHRPTWHKTLNAVANAFGGIIVTRQAKEIACIKLPAGQTKVWRVGTTEPLVFDDPTDTLFAKERDLAALANHFNNR